MRAVELGDGAIGEVLQVGEQVVDALDAPAGVIAEHRHRALESCAGGDPLGGRRHLRLDAVQLVPAPGVDLLGVAVHAEPPPDADGVQLAADGVRFRGARRVLLAQESRRRRVRLGSEPGAVLEPRGERVVVRLLGGDACEVRRAGAGETPERGRLLSADQGLPARGDLSGVEPMPERRDEPGEQVGNAAHPGGDPLPVLGCSPRAEVERHANERDGRVEVGELAPRGARLVSLDPRSQTISDDRCGDAIRVVLDGRLVERAQGPAVEVDLRLDTGRRVVGHLVVVSRDPETGRCEGIEPAELVDIRVGEAKDLGHASSATTAPTPAIEATRSPSSSRMMITPRV